MSYSRWGGKGSGHWYTFWSAQSPRLENRDSALFSVFGLTVGAHDFTAKQLREDMDECMKKVKQISPDGDVDELRVYAKEFLDHVNEDYPKT